MDTAPTGHTLLLLDATGAYHREVTRQSAGEGTRYVTPMMQLQDPKRTKILIVTLPETTPVLEAAAPQVELRRAGIEPWAWIINQSLASAFTRSPLLRKRAQNERGPIEDVIDEYAARYAVIAVQAEEPVGIGRLRSLTRLETLPARMAWSPGLRSRACSGPLPKISYLPRASVTTQGTWPSSTVDHAVERAADRNNVFRLRELGWAQVLPPEPRAGREA